MDLQTILTFLSLTCYTFAYKILVLCPMRVRSLNILGEGYVRHLLEAGHEVTYISPIPWENKTDRNFRHIDTSNMQLSHFFDDHQTAISVGNLMQQPVDEDGKEDFLQHHCVDIAKATFEHKDVQALLNDSNEKFDVVISDLIETELYAALAEYYDCPMIWAYSLGPHWTTLRLIDEVTNPAFATDYLTSDVPPLHSIKSRVKKLWAQIRWSFKKWHNIMPMEKKVYEKTFSPLFAKKNKSLPDYSAVIYNASLVFSNDFVGNGPIQSLPQNFKFIGGQHIDIPAKPLPEELQTIFDNSKDGVIYMSLGSGWESKDFPEHVRKGLLDLFGTLNETVIWKYEDDLTDVPKNVHLLKWAPQQSILAHSKCKFFISHGGMLSTVESVHYGVPTIGLPIYFDQFMNINRAVLSGRTIKVSLTLNLVEDLRVAIQEMLRNSTYKQRALKLSQIYHDRQSPPGKELVHWVEHVVKTGGAPHLRSPASMMPLTEKLFLDVSLIALAVAIVLIVILYLLKNYFCCREKSPEKRKRVRGKPLLSGSRLNK